MKSFLYAFRGIGYLLSTQRNARFHALATVLVVAGGFWVELDRFEWCLVALACGLVLVAEALNTAVECLADALHPDPHPGIGHAKDVAAGGVLLASLAATLLGALLFLPKVW